MIVLIHRRRFIPCIFYLFLLWDWKNPPIYYVYVHVYMCARAFVLFSSRHISHPLHSSSYINISQIFTKIKIFLPHTTWSQTRTNRITELLDFNFKCKIPNTSIARVICMIHFELLHNTSIKQDKIGIILVI